MNDSQTEYATDEVFENCCKALVNSIQAVSGRIFSGTASDKEYEFLPDAARALKCLCEP